MSVGSQCIYRGSLCLGELPASWGSLCLGGHGSLGGPCVREGLYVPGGGTVQGRQQGHSWTPGHRRPRGAGRYIGPRLPLPLHRAAAALRAARGRPGAGLRG